MTKENKIEKTQQEKPVSFLENIKNNIATKVIPPITCIIGDGGKGKTYLASQASKYLGDVLLLDFDKGGYAYPVPRVEVSTLSDFYIILKELRHAPKKIFDVVIIDHMHDVANLFIKEILKNEVIVEYVDGRRVERNPESLDEHRCSNLNFNKGKGLLNAKWEKFISYLKDIRDERNVSFILIGHIKIERRELDTGEVYDVQTIKLPADCGTFTAYTADNVYILGERAIKSEEERLMRKNKFSKTKYKGNLSVCREIVTSSNSRGVSKARIALPEEIYDISDPEGVETFWTDYNEIWTPKMTIVHPQNNNTEGK